MMSPKSCNKKHILALTQCTVEKFLKNYLNTSQEIGLDRTGSA